MRSRDGVDIIAFAEGLAHGLFVRNMGKDAQLDLAVIRINQHAAGFGNEHLADLRAEVSTDRDVLQVRLCRGQAAGGRHQILEGCVDTAIVADFFQKAIRIGGFQLCQHPVVHDSRDNGVPGFQLFQDICIGGVAGFGFLHRRQA